MERVATEVVQMRFLMLMALLAVRLVAQDLAGRWVLRFTEPREQWPKMVSEIKLDLKHVDGKLTGTVHAGNWPGDAPISDIKVVGNRVSFNATGQSPWRSSSLTGGASGYPKLDFEGTFDGREMVLKLTWGDVLIYSTYSAENRLAPTVYRMRGEKTP
jgi:hypothetical protein